ncbi:PAS domain S-box-containing protein [Spirosoma oryzae]|uniref:histidine kinase n=1 Tax=Spirosoma oryzae TaxID=1469603 RepID=A0A2T0SQ56_9BACT|nr:ATP-binding protein [Spirosoma oryzae]PRY35544.1 PAS domain S-box-containing protein [Spirosoma oryzae]
MTGEQTLLNDGRPDQLARMHVALQAAAIGTWDLDIKNQQVWWDDHCKQLYGFYQNDIVPYEQVLRYVHADDVATLDKAVQWALTPQSAGHYDCQFRTIGAEDGQLRWLHCRGQAFFDEMGIPYRFSGIAQDITQLVLARQQTQRSEQRFRNLVYDSPTATVVFMGRDMVVQAINEPMLTIWGKDDAVLGKSLHGAMPELIGQPFLELLQHVYDTGEAYHNPEGKAAIVVDGKLEEFWFSFSYNPLYDDNGQIYGIINTAVDISEQVTARRLLAANEARQTFLLTLSDQLRPLLDPAQMQYRAACLLGDYVGANRVGYAEDQGDGIAFIAANNYVNGVAQITGYFRYTDFGQPLAADLLAGRTAVQPDVAQATSLSETERKAYRSLQVGAALNKPLLKDGRLLAVMFVHHQDAHAWSPDELTLLDETAERTWEAIERARVEAALRQREEQYRALSQELEERVRSRTQELELANQDLERSNDSLQQFAYVASHDLQEPLRKIQAFCSLLEQQISDQLTDTGRHYIERITDASARMSTLIKDLLAFSRLSIRQQTLQSVSLDSVVKDVLSTLDWAVSQHHAQLDVTPLPVVNGDEMQLRQLFQNLLSNALKFTPAGQSARVAIHSMVKPRRELPDHVKPTSDAHFFHQICIQDAGIGFDEKYLDRIFQVFQRLHSKNDFPGTGVGLAICQRVVENHGGGITAESRPGEGATFYVYLPA